MFHFRDKPLVPTTFVFSKFPSNNDNDDDDDVINAAYLRNPAATAVTKSSIRYERISVADDFPCAWFRSRDTFLRMAWQSCNSLPSLSHEQFADSTNDTDRRRKSRDTSLGDIPFVDPHVKSLLIFPKLMMQPPIPADKT